MLYFVDLEADYMGQVDSVPARLQPSTRSLLYEEVQLSHYRTNPLSTRKKIKKVHAL